MTSLAIIPPLSVVRLTGSTQAEPTWSSDDLGRTFRVGYYSQQDGLDCVWLVDESGNYEQTVNQAMIHTDFEVLYRSDETDPFGVDRPIIGHMNES